LLGRASYCTGLSLEKHIKGVILRGARYFAVADVLALRARLDKGREPTGLAPQPTRFERGLLEDWPTEHRHRQYGGNVFCMFRKLRRLR
jgi:hypothetical protein